MDAFLAAGNLPERIDGYCRKNGMRAQGFATGSLETLRSRVHQAQPPRVYSTTPRGLIVHDNISD